MIIGNNKKRNKQNMDRLVFVHTSLDDKLRFRSMQGTEAISTLFQYQVELISFVGDLDLTTLLGQSLSLQIKQIDGTDHWLNGDITAMELKGMEAGASRYYVYEATVRPHMWYLSQNLDFRVFQEQTVPEIIMQFFSEYDIVVDNRLTRDYRQWYYCVQYNESAFNFISRLMEHEGIYYFFSHQQGQHTLILADGPHAHQPIEQPLIPYRGPNASAILDEICVDHWRVSNAITIDRVSMDDYDFHKPYAHLLETKNNRLSYSAEQTELFEWPGRFINRDENQTYIQIRQQEKAAQHYKIAGAATTSRLVAGSKMTLTHAPRTEDNREYMVISSHYKIWDNTYASGEDADRGQYCNFNVVPADIIWRSPRITAWPKTQGPQTARVVCPPGETIWTDEYGRVKVKFHWDRYAKDDDTSSCWVRVATSWAGMSYGAIQIPRINEEVLVDFINGDPDRPIIIGRVYNQANMPPWSLPGSATQMGIYSRSKNGHKGMANILRFEDANGAEEVYIQAQRDFNQQVRRNKSYSIGNDCDKQVGNDQHVIIARDDTININRDQHITIDNDQKIIIKNNQQVEIGHDQQMKIGAHHRLEIMDRSVEIVHANKLVDIAGDYETNVQGKITTQANVSAQLYTKTLTLTGTDKVVIQGPAGKITIDQGGVSIDAGLIKLNGAVAVSTTSLGAIATLKSAANEGTPLVEVCPECNN